ncbi:MAG: chromosome partitioning protein [Pseudonocardiales bacterium]|nr:chromosome partitioning protein [Pseudonocardiales bacterium]
MTPGIRVLTIANLKGGSAKTTTAAFLAHAFHERGRKVVLVDADPQGSALRWHGLADWPVPALGLASTALHRQLWGVIDPARWDTVVIDTPPLEERDGIVAATLRVATDVLVPIAPTMMELDRVGPVFKALEDAGGRRDEDPNVAVLLTRTVAHATSTETVREILESQGRRVLFSTVPRLERYAQAFGAGIPEKDVPYGTAAEEIMGGWGR